MNAKQLSSTAAAWRPPSRIWSTTAPPAARCWCSAVGRPGEESPPAAGGEGHPGHPGSKRRRHACGGEVRLSLGPCPPAASGRR
ncbi:MAG: hypothetical protein ACLTYN_14650 [Dysosmobacter welbionis]